MRLHILCPFGFMSRVMCGSMTFGSVRVLLRFNATLLCKINRDHPSDYQYSSWRYRKIRQSNLAFPFRCNDVSIFWHFVIFNARNIGHPDHEYCAQLTCCVSWFSQAPGLLRLLEIIHLMFLQSSSTLVFEFSWNRQVVWVSQEAAARQSK